MCLDLKENCKYCCICIWFIFWLALTAYVPYHFATSRIYGASVLENYENSTFIPPTLHEEKIVIDEHSITYAN